MDQSVCAGVKKFRRLNKIRLTVQIVKLIKNENLPLVLPVCPLPQTACTYQVHSNSPYLSTVLLPARRH